MQNDALTTELAACASPETLLATIFKHHPDLQAPVPVEPLALDLGIVALRDLERDAASGAPIAALDQPGGIIRTAPGLPPQRRRFAIAHALGHHLLAAHTGPRDCTMRDLAENRRDTAHRKEEMQANRFAAGLLMPKPLFAAFVAGLGKPAVAHLPVIATAYDVTLDAAASRYADLTQAMCALVFIKDGMVRLVRPSRSFPPLAITRGDPAPPTPPSGTKGKASWVPAEIRDWLVTTRDKRPPKLTLQTLALAGGGALIMLFVNAAAERRADEEAEKFATERPKFGDGRRG